MDIKNVLIVDKQKVISHFGISEKDVMEGVKTLREWMENQPHLPEVLNDNMIEAILINNKVSIERSKQKLDMYYTMRTLIPDFYQNALPTAPHMQKIMDQVNLCPLRTPTDELFRVIFTSMKKDVEDLNVNDSMAFFLNHFEIRFNEDLVLGDIIIIDMENVKLVHILKLTPTYMKKFVTILEKVLSNRLKGIHFINCPTYVDVLVDIFKAAFKAKLAKRIFVHASLDSLYKMIPKTILPKDLGGDDLSVDDISELWKLKMLEYQGRFEKLATLKVKEDLRPSPLVNDEILGFYGNFKKLALD